MLTAILRIITVDFSRVISVFGVSIDEARQSEKALSGSCQGLHFLELNLQGALAIQIQRPGAIHTCS